MTTPDTVALRYLDPPMLRFARRGATLVLTIAGDCSYPKVTVARAFPLSAPHSYLTVRDCQNKEIGVLRDLPALDPESHRLVAEEIERRYLVPVVQRIIAVKERFGTVDWTVATDRGERRFTTRNLRENLTQPAPGRFLLSDVDGNRYNVRDLGALDTASQAMLMRYL